MSIAYTSRSRLPVGMWRAHLDRSGVSPSARLFAMSVLGPMMARSGAIRPAGGRAELVQRYAEQRGRSGYTTRRVRQLLAELVGAGLLIRVRRAAPGRAATYGARVPGTDLPRPMLVRPRGIQGRLSKGILASFHRERERDGP